MQYVNPLTEEVVDINEEQGVRISVQQAALRAIVPHKRAGLHISMGVGKTYIGLQYLDIIKGKTLVVAPKVSIFDSWTNDARKFNLDHLLDDVSFSTYISLNKHNPEDYDTVILDEAHNAKESHVTFLSRFDGNILGLTGTPPRFRNSEKGKVMQEFYPIRYVYTVDEAVGSEILNDYEIMVHSMPLSEVKDLKTKQGWYSSEQKQYSWVSNWIQEAQMELDDKKVFNRRIFRINYLKQFKTKENYVKRLLRSIPQDEKCLVFVNTTDQADSLFRCTHHSKNSKQVNKENLEAFSSGQVTRMGAVEQLSEGITIPDLKHIIILHAYGNEKRASQKIGRALRLSPEETSNIHVLCYRNTVDEDWVKSALKDFDEKKINWLQIVTG